MHEDDEFLPDEQAEENEFDRENLVKTVIAIPLLRDIQKDDSQLLDVIIDVNIRYAGGREAAQNEIFKKIESAIKGAGDQVVRPNDRSITQTVKQKKSENSQQYVYAVLQGKVIRR